MTELQLIAKRTLKKQQSTPTRLFAVTLGACCLFGCCLAKPAQQLVRQVGKRGSSWQAV